MDSSNVVAAVAALVHDWSVSQPWEDHRLFSGLTCTEAESLAEVFRALGADAVARHVIEAHAAGDNEPDDQHHDLFLVLERGE